MLKDIQRKNENFVLLSSGKTAKRRYIALPMYSKAIGPRVRYYLICCIQKGACGFVLSHVAKKKKTINKSK
jgi:hypothetical protein